MFGQFLRLALTMFVRTLGDDVFKFMTYCEERLCNLGLVEVSGVKYTTFQFDPEARQWWKGYVDSIPIVSPLMTQT